MKIKSGRSGALLVTMAVFGNALLDALPVRLGAQEDVLQSPSDTDLRVLREQQRALQMFGMGPFDNPITQMTSPDSQALQILNEAAREGASALRAITDLLTVYDNMQCGPDRATVRALLEDRLRMYARLLGILADQAAIPVGKTNLSATTKKALELRDQLVIAKNKLDAIAASLK
jgi:hypothetical protein